MLKFIIAPKGVKSRKKDEKNEEGWGGPVGTLASPRQGGRHSRDQDEGDASVPTPLPTTPALKGRYVMMSPRKRLRPRRGGGRVVRGGDACVAHGGREQATGEQDEGDASVPTPHNPTPAPTGTKGLPGRH